MADLSDPTALAQEWNRVRAAFAGSIMVDTPLASLAEDLDGPAWPVPGAAETPAAYIDYDYEEVLEILALKGQPAKLLPVLIGLLQETLAFDDPFGEMVDQSANQADRDNPIRRNLAKLGIPEDYPIALCTLEPSTQEFCRLEQLVTLGQFAIFAQGMARNVVMGGDFKALLNALSHVDEQVIARHLPYRPGTPGLHLIEAVALAVRSAPAAAREDPADSVTVQARVEGLVNYFEADLAALRQRLAAGESWERVGAVLGDPKVEPWVGTLLKPHLGVEPPPTSPRSWWRRWLNK